jgi:Cu/Ag efflux protein CusF
MKRAATAAAFAVAMVLVTTLASAQAPQTVRLRGVIETVDGNTVSAKSDKGEALKLNLADKTMVVAVVKASLADIKPGDFIGSGAMPQPDGSQKAVEVHIFAESMRGTGEGFRPWDAAPNSTMTNGTVGSSVTGVNGPVLTVAYKGGEQKIIVGPTVPVVKYEGAERSELKPGVAFSVFSAAKQPDGSFNVSRISVGRDGVVPR